MKVSRQQHGAMKPTPKPLCTLSKPEDLNYTLQLEYKEAQVDPEPLCMLSPLLTTQSASSDWVIQKVKDIQECVEISYVGFEKQFRALFIAINVGQFQSPRFAYKRNRELNRLTCSINYDGREGSTSKSRSKGKAVLIHKA
ncbi:hypothetical protein CIPAW_05G029900 [Carya illinoinensis]|uniref:Uncharacterized protein n=1 Tax=Carya illinoinensis TaxID=32201 RepID=A0A8T1QEG5_CARIL|nr:hypothetical protein CIPAW_05G029900 [Carya illinoinensis]